jgi:hypothetical protein
LPLQYHDSLVSYEKATKVVTTHLGPQHPLVTSLTDSYKAALKKMSAKRAKDATKSGSASAAGLSANPSKSRLDALASKSAKDLQGQLQSMPDSHGMSDGEYDASHTQAHPSGFASD